MKNRTTIITVIIFVIAGVAYFWFSSADQQSQADSPMMDSVSTSERPSIEASPDTVPPPVGEDLAPGTAVVQMEIASVTYNEGNPAEMVGRVQEVLGYGSSTSSIAVGSDMTLNISGFLEMNPDYKDTIKKDSTVILQLTETTKGIQQINGSSKSNPWIINRFIE